MFQHLGLRIRFLCQFPIISESFLNHFCESSPFRTTAWENHFKKNCMKFSTCMARGSEILVSKCQIFDSLSKLLLLSGVWWNFVSYIYLIQFWYYLWVFMNLHASKWAHLHQSSVVRRSQTFSVVKWLILRVSCCTDTTCWCSNVAIVGSTGTCSTSLFEAVVRFHHLYRLYMTLPIIYNISTIYCRSCIILHL